MSRSAGAEKRKYKKFSYFDVLENLLPWKGDAPAEVIRKIIFLVSVIVFSVCSYYVFSYFYENYQNDQLYKEIREEIPELSGTIPNDVQNSYETGEMRGDIRRLMDINSDIVGYIRIPDMNGNCDDTQVSYPIVQKTDEDEREYYLDRNIRKEKTIAGSIFLDWRNIMGGPDQSDNLIIYGHQMYNGSMFGSLSQYNENHFFYGTHPCIELTTRYDQSVYKIFAFFFGYGGEDNDDFAYYNTIDFYSEDNFYWYVNEIKKRSLVNNEVDIKYGDDLLILSTCSTGSFTEARFVVAARKVRPGEDRYSGTDVNSRNDNVLMPAVWYKESGRTNTFDESKFVPYSK